MTNQMHQRGSDVNSYFQTGTHTPSMRTSTRMKACTINQDGCGGTHVRSCTRRDGRMQPLVEARAPLFVLMAASMACVRGPCRLCVHGASARRRRKFYFKKGGNRKKQAQTQLLFFQRAKRRKPDTRAPYKGTSTYTIMFEKRKECGNPDTRARDIQTT